MKKLVGLLAFIMLPLLIDSADACFMKRQYKGPNFPSNSYEYDCGDGRTYVGPQVSTSVRIVVNVQTNQQYYVPARDAEQFQQNCGPCEVRQAPPPILVNPENRSAISTINGSSMLCTNIRINSCGNPGPSGWQKFWTGAENGGRELSAWSADLARTGAKRFGRNFREFFSNIGKALGHIFKAGGNLVGMGYGGAQVVVGGTGVALGEGTAGIAGVLKGDSYEGRYAQNPHCVIQPCPETTVNLPNGSLVPVPPTGEPPLAVPGVPRPMPGPSVAAPPEVDNQLRLNSTMATCQAFPGAQAKAYCCENNTDNRCNKHLCYMPVTCGQFSMTAVCSPVEGSCARVNWGACVVRDELAIYTELSPNRYLREPKKGQSY